MTKEEIKDYLKNNLKMIVSKDISNVDYREVEIYLEDERLLRFGVNGYIYVI